MGVIVEEMTSEVGDPPVPPSESARGGAAAGPTRDVDLDRLEYAMRRRQHRIERLWAD
ncbi:hypothetical protein MZO42_16265 [Sphingomonas psychrotolerans]|uniref:Uncharacterized protein n=1 Tax=Sphingomonas psychrotolerans TaxID=1327635 RepID=A0ABU3N7L5_9SPHN|nr:hypothetical protein [Sphingomonas psychrotolerans]MDT8760256.1 hypothetical protein [Sphingomonas psychrotolerans]